VTHLQSWPRGVCPEGRHIGIQAVLRWRHVIIQENDVVAGSCLIQQLVARGSRTLRQQLCKAAGRQGSAHAVRTRACPLMCWLCSSDLPGSFG
jgi:hypothetical protein